MTSTSCMHARRSDLDILVSFRKRTHTDQHIHLSSFTPWARKITCIYQTRRSKAPCIKAPCVALPKPYLQKSSNRSQNYCLGVSFLNDCALNSSRNSHLTSPQPTTTMMIHNFRKHVSNYHSLTNMARI